MALISIFRCITLAALVLLGEAQSRVITTDFNATGLSLEGQGGALAMRRFKDDHRMSQKALLTDEDLQNRLLESESEDDDRESIVDLILSQEQNPSHPYLQFLNEHGGAARVFNSSSEIPTESGGAGDDTEHNESDDEQRNSATEAGRIMLSVTRDSRTKKIDLKRFKETVQRNVSKLLHNDHNRIHPQKKKFSGFRTQPRFRNRTKRQIELYMYNINHNDTDRRKRHRKMRMQTVCSALTGKEEIAPNPLMCYQCESYSSEKEPRCDVVLWNYLRESEKHYIRIRCPKNRGHYCVKSVSRKSTDFSDRITRRGCVGPGPLPTKVGKHIGIREGCISYVEGDYWTTTCFCKSDLCNESSRLIPDASRFTLIMFFWALFIYVLAFSFASR